MAGAVALVDSLAVKRQFAATRDGKLQRLASN
jgi:hypothetical protein